MKEFLVFGACVGIVSSIAAEDYESAFAKYADDNEFDPESYLGQETHVVGSAKVAKYDSEDETILVIWSE